MGFFYGTLKHIGFSKKRPLVKIYIAWKGIMEYIGGGLLKLESYWGNWRATESNDTNGARKLER